MKKLFGLISLMLLNTSCWAAESKERAAAPQITLTLINTLQEESTYELYTKQKYDGFATVRVFDKGIIPARQTIHVEVPITGITEVRVYKGSMGSCPVELTDVRNVKL